jgi:hypothetical protein
MKNNLITELPDWNEVNKITDKLGRGIDDKIKNTVTAFMAHGFFTSQSCEGHPLEENRGYPFPWVEIYCPEPEGWRHSEGIIHEEKSREWTIENLKQQQKMINLLAEFYKERETPFDARLIFEYIGSYGGFRVQSFGGVLIRLLSLRERHIKLELYRKEIHDFALYLTDKYFSARGKNG